MVAVIGTEYETSSPAQVSKEVTVAVSPAGVGTAAAAMAAACAVLTQTASALSVINIGHKAADSATNNAANERSLFI